MADSVKPRLAKGTRDFGPEEMKLRNHIISTIRSVFELYSFDPIETPAVENMETLTGKYGEEGDQLIFRILNSGDFLKDADAGLLSGKNSERLAAVISEKALRYDLTVPFARFVTMKRNELAFPFRRYQVQPVWRADRPQKGRYREFYQCDADIIGTDSLQSEGELLALCGEVFRRLKIKATIHLNSRKLLMGFCQAHGIEDKFTAFTVILDKMDKKPWEEIRAYFEQSGFSAGVIESTEALKKRSSVAFGKQALEGLGAVFMDSGLWKEGAKELREIAEYLEASGEKLNIVLNLSLARGLTYYTGAIIEVKSDEHSIGSICGGGRYDNLTGIFGMPGVSGVGISFGIDRIFDILTAGGADASPSQLKKVVLVNFGPELLAYNLAMLAKLRGAGISAELYPEADKLKKQFGYADKKKADYVLVAGDKEMKEGSFSLKDLRSGEQRELKAAEIIAAIKT